MIDFQNCIEQGLLKRIPPSPKQAEEQLKKAEVLLAEAKKALEAGSFNSAVIVSYAAALDAAKALLFKDGYREKSHACVVRYLEAKYSRELGIPLIELFDHYRDKRHKTLYIGTYYPMAEEAKRIVSFAEELVKKTGLLLKLS